MGHLAFHLSISLAKTILILINFLRIEGIREHGFASDNVREDDYEDFELSDIIALSDTTVDWPEDAVGPEDRERALELHNTYRRNHTYPFPKISDINMLEYNNTLEWSAGLHLKSCLFQHFFGPGENMSDVLGQCIYRGWARPPDRHVFMYHYEYRWYNFNNFTCWQPYPKYNCDHMLQLMMGETEHIGWQRRLCFPRDRGYLSTYHYSFGGVIWDREYNHFRYGESCSACSPGFSCSNNLCIPHPERACKDYNLDCECKRTCYNCATVDLKNCRCMCKLGWDWGHCSYPCMDIISKRSPIMNCAKNKKLYQHCTTFKNWHYSTVFCRITCKHCKPIKPDSQPEDLCCNGKICEPYHRLDLDTCECVRICPSLLCLFPTTTTTNRPNILLTETNGLTSADEKSLASSKAPQVKFTTEKEPRAMSKGFVVIANLRMLLGALSVVLIS